jgi:hypothetical protein
MTAFAPGKGFSVSFLVSVSWHCVGAFSFFPPSWMNLINQPTQFSAALSTNVSLKH